MTQLALVLVSFFCALSAVEANYSPRDKYISDAELQMEVCRAKGVYDMPLEQDDLARAACQETSIEYRFKGFYSSENGDTTIYRYEIAKLGYEPCTVFKYWVPSQREVVIDASADDENGKIRLTKGRWDWKALVPDGQGACFQ